MNSELPSSFSMKEEGKNPRDSDNVILKILKASQFKSLSINKRVARTGKEKKKKRDEGERKRTFSLIDKGKTKLPA